MSPRTERSPALWVAVIAVVTAGIAGLVLAVMSDPEPPTATSGATAESAANDPAPVAAPSAPRPELATAATEAPSLPGAEVSVLDVDPAGDTGEPDDGASEHAPTVDVEEEDPTLTPDELRERKRRAVAILDAAIDRYEAALAGAREVGDDGEARAAELRLSRLRDVRARRAADLD